MRKSELRSLGEDIWTNWWNGCGPCNECPNRDSNGYFNPKYFDSGLISGDPDPEVVLIGNTPVDKHPNGGKREILDFEEPYWDERESSLEWEIQSQKNVLSWLSEEYQGFPKFFAQLEKWPVWGGGVYYTNAKKCSDITLDDSKNKQAYGKCNIYLEKQLELLDPQVIVTFGKNAFGYTMEVFDREPPEGPLRDAINAKDDEGRIFASYGEQPAVIPAYHYSRPHNYSKVAGVEGVEDNFLELAKAIKRFI